MDEKILYEVKNKVAYITISRPKKMNSITKAMAEDLNRLAPAINEDDGVRVVVLQGDGERAFSTGSDINLLKQYGTPFELRNRQDYCAAIRSIRKPVISKVKGYALGGGFELVLATDIRVAVPEAKFAASEVKNGWISGSGLIQVLTRNIGYAKAAGVILTGDMIDGTKGVDLGFLTELVSLEDIDAYVVEMAEKMTELSPIALQLAKQDMVASQNMGLDMGLQYENDLFAFSMTTEDAAEGKAAFAEKRAPRF